MNPRYSQLQASIDWYRIEIDHAVAQIDAGEILGLCFDPRVNPDFSPAGVLAGGMAIIAQPQLRLAQCLRDRTQPLHRLDAGHVRA